MPLQPVVRRSVSADVFEQIAADVLSGELPPGSTLPSERQLAEALGVSRPAVREALQRLAGAGLVAVRQGDATTVLDYRHGSGLEILPRLLIRDGVLEPAVARSILEVRLHNGPKVAELAAARLGRLRAAVGDDPSAALSAAGAAPNSATDAAPRGAAGTASPHAAGAAAVARRSDIAADIVAAAEAVAAEAGDPIAAQRAALTFWDHVVDAADSIVFRLMFTMLRAAYEPALAALAPVMSAEVGNAEAYRALAAAVADGDPDEAAALARALLEPATTALIEILTPEEQR
ncbi:FadR/GntR family transcriptional regulator [Nocardia asteroides]|uniref:FadR/GntR family transcriptional regulator n=1 Tax=Nocardia asteroides TaxID=1824 RepID=UPI001E3839CB|nr:GntR family transcriptional regulator [Nocardia asteroides]UGT59378.1 GntR family transcriptional regulator [Nocardia asteroides]